MQFSLYGIKMSTQDRIPVEAFELTVDERRYLPYAWRLLGCEEMGGAIPVTQLGRTRTVTEYLPYAWRLLGCEEMGGAIPVTQLGRIMRGFGKNPAEKDLQYLKFNNGIDDERRLLYNECVDLYKQCQSEVDSLDKLLAAFRVFDKDGTGKILVTDLRDIMTRLGEPITEKEVEHMVQVADHTQSGTVNYEDFCRLVMTDNRPLLQI